VGVMDLFSISITTTYLIFKRGGCTGLGQLANRVIIKGKNALHSSSNSVHHLISFHERKHRIEENKSSELQP